MAEDTTPTSEGTTATDAGRTFTQADVDRIVGERIGRERKQYEGLDIDDLKTKAGRLAEIEAAQQTATEKLAAERDTHKTAATRTAAENMRLRVALEKKLPALLIDRLQGDDKATMEADADALLEMLSPTPGLDGGARTPAPAGDFDAMIRRAARRGQ
jgi:hypothetical protein